MKFILGTKLGMTQIWKGESKKAVTKVKVGPCKIIQIKTKDVDGYEAVQLGFGEKKVKNIKKPQLGHLKGAGNFRYLREFRLDKNNNKVPEMKVGDIINVDTFAPGDKIQLTSISKGRGFQGVVKRYNFRGQKATHGTKDQMRMPGSIGATGPAHVFKGMRMPGRMGNDRVTIKNIEVVDIDQENNILFLNGSVPGANNGLVLIAGVGELKLKVEKQKEVKKTESKSEEITKKEAPKEDKELGKEEKVETKAEDNKNIVEDKKEETEVNPESKTEATKNDHQEQTEKSTEK